jgi:acetyl esterase/lipase
VLDLWLAKSDRRTPLVLYIHGGGFNAGDKRSVPPILLTASLASGISVASINYRLSHQASFPAPMHDGARAVQFLRHRADQWNLDPDRFAATGASAGAGISLWLGFHDDLADPASDDPVLRKSSRLMAMGVFNAQSTYDPRMIQKIVGGRAHQHPTLLPFYGLAADEGDTSKAYRLYEAASPINFVSRDDPPVFLFYNEPKAPLPADAQPGQGIHHPNFGTALKDKLDPLGIKCMLRHVDEYPDPSALDAPFLEMLSFFQEQFRRDDRQR